MTTIHVDSGDPHNDQILAMTVEDLREHMAIVRDVLNQAEKQNAPLSSIMAVLATHWINQEEKMPRERLASLLALSLIQLHAHTLQDESKEFSEFISKITN